MNTSKLTRAIDSGYSLLAMGAGYLQSPLLLAVRLYWGWSFFQSGWGKLHTHEQVTEFFTTLSIPMPGLSAWMAGGTECFGGLLLLAGLGSRAIALPLIFTMMIAYLTADLETVQHVFSEPDKFTGADPFLFLFASIIILAFGPGFFSLDRLVGGMFGREAEAVPAKPFVSPAAGVTAG
jgi:putative oxidoreductase